MDEATGGNDDSIEAYHAFHKNIQRVCEIAAKCEAGRGKALLIDVHGHGHADDWFEVGHLVSASILRSKRGMELPPPGEEWIRGENSFGAFLMRAGQKEGIQAVPSPEIPFPARKQKYFSGGFITRHYKDAKVQTMQLEVPPCRYRKDSANVIADALEMFLIAWNYLQDADKMTNK